MDLPDAKQLKKLAQACRKAGVKTLKYGDLEITIGDEPTKATKTRKESLNAPQASTSDSIESDDLSPDELMFWSVNSLPEPNPGPS